MKTLLTLALIAGFAVSANATGSSSTTETQSATPAAVDCSQLTDANAKAQCEAAKSQASAPAAEPAKKK